MKLTLVGKNNFTTLMFRQEQSVVRKWSVKKVFLEISQISLENTYTKVSFLIKLQASGLQLY